MPFGAAKFVITTHRTKVRIKRGVDKRQRKDTMPVNVDDRAASSSFYLPAAQHQELPVRFSYWHEPQTARTPTECRSHTWKKQLQLPQQSRVAILFVPCLFANSSWSHCLIPCHLQTLLGNRTRYCMFVQCTLSGFLSKLRHNVFDIKRRGKALSVFRE